LATLYSLVFIFSRHVLLLVIIDHTVAICAVLLLLLSLSTTTIHLFINLCLLLFGIHHHHHHHHFQFYLHFHSLPPHVKHTRRIQARCSRCCTGICIGLTMDSLKVVPRSLCRGT